MADWSQLEFVSILDEDPVNKNERIYDLTIKMLSKSGDKTSTTNKKLSLTEVYDAKGYLHRYIVKEQLEDSLKKVKDFCKNELAGKESKKSK